MGRRARSPEGAATRKITVRLPEPVADAWTASAHEAGLTMSDWIRLRAADPAAGDGFVGRQPPRRRSAPSLAAAAPKVDPRVAAQLSRIGNNLNQTARVLHRSGGPLDLAGLLVLRSIAEAIDSVLADEQLRPGGNGGR